MMMTTTGGGQGETSHSRNEKRPTSKHQHDGEKNLCLSMAMVQQKTTTTTTTTKATNNTTSIPAANDDDDVRMFVTTYSSLSTVVSM
jgi:hypothetical protein